MMGRKICKIDECNNFAVRHGFCLNHCKRKVCKIDNCENFVVGQGLCSKHCARIRKSGEFKHIDYDIRGQRFGMVTVIEKATPYISPKGYTSVQYRCKCDCGQEFVCHKGSLMSGGTTSCGCKHHRKGKDRPNTKDLTGQTHGRLTVLKMVGSSAVRETLFRCKCTCGNEIICRGVSLTSGNTTSCGCRRRETWARMIGDKNPAWNPSLTDKEREHRREHRKSWSNDYGEWAQAVKERDDFTCRACRRRGSIYLESHHIVSWKKFPKCRYDVENGATLCRDCHRQFHRIFGRIDCNAIDLLKFCEKKIRSVA